MQGMLTQPMITLLARYIAPTVAAMLVTGIYATVDGIFIGHLLGADGLAGVSLGYPLASLLTAVGAMIGMGGSTLVSLKLGEGLLEDARRIAGVAVIMVMIASLLLMLAGLSLGHWGLTLIGAQGDVLALAWDYLFWSFVLGPAAVGAMAFTALMRNDGHPGRVTWIMIGGGVLNIVLDYLLIVVFPYGLAGAAIATMIAQGVVALIALSNFFSHRSKLRLHLNNLAVNADDCRSILRLGMASLLMYLFLSVVLTLHNKAFLTQGETIHVAAYGIVGYVEWFFYLIFEGIALGMQPITSYSMGAGRMDRVRAARNGALVITLIVGGIALGVTYGWPEVMVGIFNGEGPSLGRVTVEGMALYFWSVPLEGLLLVGAVYFQSIGKTQLANVLTGGKLILFTLVILLFAWVWGVTGIWLSLPVTNLLLTIWLLLKLFVQNADDRGLDDKGPGVQTMISPSQ
jgi:putative MATE family efflux protein